MKSFFKPEGGKKSNFHLTVAQKLIK